MSPNPQVSLRIWSHLLTKSLMENFTFCVVYIVVEYKRKGNVIKYVNS